MKTARVHLVLLLGILSSSCAQGGRSLGDSPFQGGAQQETLVLRVQNENIHEVSVFLVTGGKEQLLGKVDSRSVRFLEFSMPRAGALSLRLETIVGDRYRLPAHPLTRAGRIELTIANELRRSLIR